MKVGIVIPAYNAERTIKNVLLQVLKFAAPDNVFVIDDGSSDRTYEIVEKLNVNVIRHQKNLGKGEALKSGFNELINLKFDAVLTMDSDGQHSPEKIPEFINIMENCQSDLVLGVRSLNFSNMPFDRVLSNKISSFIVSLACGRAIKDSQCGFRLIRIEKLGDLILTGKRYELESELIILAGIKGWNIDFCSIPVIYNGSGSSINRTVDTLRFCKMVVKMVGKR